MSKRKSQPGADPCPPTPSTTVGGADQLQTVIGIAVASAAVALAIVLRFWASLDAFWLDEIWSWEFAGLLKSPLEVVTRLHHDNNHHLNTFILYLMGRNAPTYLYRLPAVLAGIGTVVLSGWVARQWSRPAAVAATLLTGSSFLLIQYSSEARGYGYVMLFTMASFAALQASLERPRPIWNVLFAGCAILGFLSHLTYLFAYVALVSWSCWRRIRDEGWLSRAHILPLVFQILIPGSFVLLLYVVDLRYMQVGGGPAISAWTVIAQAMSVALGGPFEGPACAWVSIAVGLVAVAALFVLFRSGSDLWVPMSLGILIVPAVVLLLNKSPQMYVRYFLVSALLLQLLLSWFFGWLYQQSYGKMFYVLALAAILIGNGILTVRFLKYGRGDYEAAVRDMLAQTVSERVTVASDHDFRNQVVLAYYFGRANDGSRAIYYVNGKWPPEGPEWFIMHSFEQRFSPDKSAQDDLGHTYELAHVYPYAGLSGFNWALYHNTNRPTNAPLQATPQGPSAR